MSQNGRDTPHKSCGKSCVLIDFQSVFDLSPALGIKCFWKKYSIR